MAVVLKLQKLQTMSARKVRINIKEDCPVPCNNNGYNMAENLALLVAHCSFWLQLRDLFSWDGTAKCSNVKTTKAKFLDFDGNLSIHQNILNARVDTYGGFRIDVYDK